jgi:hypothetical protein
MTHKGNDFDDNLPKVSLDLEILFLTHSRLLDSAFVEMEKSSDERAFDLFEKCAILLLLRRSSFRSDFVL